MDHRVQPEFRLALATADMHMHWFYRTPFVRVEKEPKSFGAKNHWHSFHLSKSLRRLSLFCEIGKKYPPPNTDNFAYFVGCFTRVLIEGVPLSLEPKRTLRSGCPKEFFWGVGIAKGPEVAPQVR